MHSSWFFIYFELFVQRFGRWSFSINCSRPGTGWHSCCSLKNVKDKNHEQTGVFNLLKVASLLHILFSVMKLNSKQVFSFYRCFKIVSEKYNRRIDLCVNLTTLILRWVFLNLFTRNPYIVLFMLKYIRRIDMGRSKRSSVRKAMLHHSFQPTAECTAAAANLGEEQLQQDFLLDLFGKQLNSQVHRCTLTSGN